MKFKGMTIAKIVGFLVLVLLMIGFLKMAVLLLFSSGAGIGLYLFSALAAFGLWNIPQFIRGIFGAKPSA